MPCRLVDDLEGEVIDEEVDECALGNDILTTDLNGEDALLLNIRVYRLPNGTGIRRGIGTERTSGGRPRPRKTERAVRARIESLSLRQI